MSGTFNGYHVWLGIPLHEQPPNHYRLLGIALFETDLDVIDHAADRQMAHVRTFQSGRNGTLSQQILNELSSARLCLLNPEKKTAYDESLRAKLAGMPRGTPIPMGKPLPRAQPIAGTIPPAASEANDVDQEMLVDFSSSSDSLSVPGLPIRVKRRSSNPDDSWQRPLVFTLVAAVAIVSLLSLYWFLQPLVGPALEGYFDRGTASPDSDPDPSVSEPSYTPPSPPQPTAPLPDPSSDTPSSRSE